MGTLLKNLKKGDYFKFAGKKNNVVYVKGDYDRSLKKYSIYKFYDVMAERFVKGDAEVVVDFEF